MDERLDRLHAADVTWALRELTSAHAEVDRALVRRLGLRPLDHLALEAVMTSVEPIGPAELGQRLGISSGSATELADRLEHAGHLLRQRHPTDRRRLELHATPSAVGQVVGALQPLVDGLGVVADTLSAAEQEVVARYLRAVTAVLQDFAETDPSTTWTAARPARPAQPPPTPLEPS